MLVEFRGKFRRCVEELEHWHGKVPNRSWKINRTARDIFSWGYPSAILVDDGS
jgi:hypothetical protein